LKHQLCLQKLKMLWDRVSVLMLVVTAVSLVSVLSTDQANALYILTGAGDSAIVLDKNVDQKTVKDFSSQMVYLGSRATGFEITLSPNLPVTVRRDGDVLRTTSRRETVSRLLQRLNVIPSPLDMVLVDISSETAVELTVGSDLTYYDRYSEFVSYDTIRKETPDLPKGTEKVAQEGSNGICTAVYEIIYSNGELVSRQLIEQERSSVVNREILVGTGEPDAANPEHTLSADVGDREDALVDVKKNADGSGVLTFASGNQMEFSSVRSMTATAYTAGYGGADYVTATGTVVGVGTVAVDKQVIPLGTRMYIVTKDGSVVYGLAVAADTGVHGNKVDLYYDTYEECIHFGRRSATVYLLK